MRVDIPFPLFNYEIGSSSSDYLPSFTATANNLITILAGAIKFHIAGITEALICADLIA